MREEASNGEICIIMAMNCILVSVCISVYNGKEFLKRCIDSVIGQDINSMEIILVDDGSTDSTLKIMQEYQKCYPEIIRIIHQEHKGLAQGRWTGVRNSTGKYIAFLDADDYLLDGAYKTIIDFMSEYKTDIYEFQTIRDGYYSRSPYTGIYDAKQVLNDYFNGVGMPVNYWLRWFKRELLVEQIFPIGISIHEDVFAFPCILNNASTIAYIDKPLHVHTTENRSSIMNKHYANGKGRDFFERQKTILLSIPHIKKNIGKERIETDYKLPFQNYVLRQYLSFVFMDTENISYEEKLDAIISTLNLQCTRRELVHYIRKNLDLNCKMNYAIKYLGLKNAYLINKIKRSL